MFLTLDYYLKKNHIFKKRSTQNLYLPWFNYIQKNFFIISTKKQRFETVYIRTFKKYLRKSYCKTKMRFFKPKFWLKIFVNSLLTKKSKNARMGAGVGNFCRCCTLVNPGSLLLVLKLFCYTQTVKLLNFICFKTKLVLKIL